MTVPKLAITGGPSGGKTTVIQFIAKEFPDVVTIVPEAASILYGGGFPRRKSKMARRHAQRAICFVQRELEDWVDAENSAKLIVCDRGSLDSVAYWPASSTDFFKSIKTNRRRELNRYEWVFHLDTADATHFDTTNPIRTETHREAIELNEKVKRAWHGHPQRLVFANTQDFFQKIHRTKVSVQMILDGYSFAEIQEFLSQPKQKLS